MTLATQPAVKASVMSPGVLYRVQRVTISWLQILRSGLCPDVHGKVTVNNFTVITVAFYRILVRARVGRSIRAAEIRRDLLLLLFLRFIKNFRASGIDKDFSLDFR